MAYYSQIIVPPRIDGEFAWNQNFRSIFIDFVSPYTKRSNNGTGRHYKHLSPIEKQTIKNWLKFIGVPFGKRKKGKIINKGVTNDTQERVAANIKYFQWVESKIPKWPWAFNKPIIRSKLLEILE